MPPITKHTGHKVTALVRSPAKLGARPNLSAVKGDVADASDVQSVIGQVDVVVSCLDNTKDVLVMEKVAEVILQAAAPCSPTRRNACLSAASAAAAVLDRLAAPSIDQWSRCICRLRACRCKDRAGGASPIYPDPTRHPERKTQEQEIPRIYGPWDIRVPHGQRGRHRNSP